MKKVTFTNGNIKLNGEKIGTYSKLMSGKRLAVYHIRSVEYRTSQRKLNDLRDIVKLSFMEG